MKLVVGENTKYHVSLETVQDFEAAILEDGFVSKWGANQHRKAVSKQLLKGLYKVSPDAVHRMISTAGKRRKAGHEVFVVVMGTQYAKCWPAFKNASRRHVYLFDAWPRTHDALKKFVINYQIDTLFVSSKQISEQLKALKMGCAVYHLPEGIRSSKFKPLPYAEKDIDVLHMGRRHEAFHECVVGPLKIGGYTYEFEREPGQLIFPAEQAFENGMARSKISICVPSGITHPDRTGGILTMTQRYLQTMLSKAIPLGICPPELKELFGYNPVVSFDEKEPVEQVLSILQSPERYKDLVERNYELVHKAHTWRHRWETAKRKMTAMPTIGNEAY